MLIRAYINCLEGTSLFHGIDCDRFEALLYAISAKTEYYKKGEAIVEMGGDISYIGVLLSGEAIALKTLLNGESILQYSILGSEVFGEVFACIGLSESPISFVATENSAVLLFEYSNLMMLHPETCNEQMIMISNLIKLLARKNLLSDRRLETLTKRTIREKLLAFLEIQSNIADNDSFVIPFNREGLSEYLCVDRSALSRELCKLQDEGIISFKKNIFTLHKTAENEINSTTAAIS